MIVEAVCPQVNSPVKQHDKDQAPLLDILDSLAPSGWALMATELPHIGPSDSKRPFKATVRDMLDVDPPSADQEAVRLSRDTDDGRIELLLVPSDTVNGLASWRGSAFWDDTESRIRSALKRKRRQVRDSLHPVLLAVRAGGITSDLEDFDQALFGRGCTVLGPDLETAGQTFIADGLFMRGSKGTPTYAGVLAFTAVGFNVCAQPVLYRHPRFDGSLPGSLSGVEERSIDAGWEGIHVRPADSDTLLEGLHLVDPDA